MASGKSGIKIAGFNERTVFFAYIDYAVQIIAFSLQFFITSRLIKSLGMPRTLVGVPLFLAAGQSVSKAVG